MFDPPREIRSALVLGGCGFLGQWLISRLTARGIGVSSVDRDPRGRLAGMGVTSIQMTTLNSALELTALMGAGDFDVVFSLVGTGLVPRSVAAPLDDLANNVGSLVVLLDVVRRMDPPPLVVSVSSAAVYGSARSVPMTEQHPRRPESPYGVSKAAGEDYLDLYHRAYGVPALCVRPFSIYGPGQRKLVIYDLLERLRGSEDPLVVQASEHITRDFVYVEDVAETIVRLAERAPARGEAYNACSEQETSLRGLVELLVGLVAPDTRVSFTGATRPGDPTRWVGSRRLTSSTTGLTPTVLTDGVDRTWRWLDESARRADVGTAPGRRHRQDGR
ncbi:MAG: NAD-dependent epimerase/dehydratase family protein [Solirubrobacteraceae bacterium]